MTAGPQGDVLPVGPRRRSGAAGLAERIARELEEDIAMGLLHPRERLVEDALMDRFDVKRHVVRAALTALEGRGAVERRANVGALVRSFSEAEVLELYAVRELLEVACARAIELPVRAGSLEAVEVALEEHAQAVRGRDHRAALRANVRFHEALFGLAPNQVLVDDVRRHARMATPIRSITVTDTALLERAEDEHRAMVHALRKGDVDALVQTCVQHLHPSRDAYLELLRARR